ncbi:exonuclease domain-containing protein [Kitasatospora sp. CM 4170]|uniref:Exonuclease domain-containing protein n=1 Tax=Kitasatospora aburaviensis TaxID=67265 RepID=A0ABW1F3L2_9ACTN|nr:exonuclease domain-containing protein [Kitasatospora sp. CM 4170]WNM45569.1 exonuclease domain-containing protein [Kitasatospora sp. CM 4170]
MSAWYEGPLAAADTETTGLDVESDRVVTATVLGVRAQRGKWPEDDEGRWTPGRLSWLADPGIEIPEAAARVHGVTTEVARAKGWPAAKVVQGMGVALAEHVAAGTPLVIMNAPYDLSLLDREFLRHGLPTLAEQAGREPLVIDPLVLDRQLDRYRPGRRNLGSLCLHYGVPLTAAHDATADALAAVRVAVEIGLRYPSVGRLSPADLHAAQAEWAPQQAARYEAYRQRTEPTATVNRHWPLIPRQGVAS